jgi:WD40 repeat protein
VASGQKLLTLSQSGFVSAASFTSDGAKLLTTALDHRAILWNTTTGEKLLEIPSVGFGPVLGDFFSSDGKQFVTFDDPDVLRLWSLEATAEAEIFAWSPISGEGIAYHPDGVHLAVIPAEQAVEVLDVRTGQSVFTAADIFTDPAQLLNNQPVFSPDGKRLAVSNIAMPGENNITVLDWVTGEKLATLVGHTDYIREITYHPDGTRLASISNDQTARMWDAITGQELFAVTAFTDSVTYFQKIDLAFSPDGARFATAGGLAIKIWDTATGQELLALPKEDLPEIAYTVAFSHDGSQLAVGFRYGAASVWDATTGEKLFDLSGHKGSVLNITYSPDGTRLATTSVDGAVRVWEAATGTLQLTFRPAEAQMLEVAFSADGRHLAVESSDGVVHIYTLDAQELAQIAHSRVTRGLTDAECVTYLHLVQCPKEP